MGTVKAFDAKEFKKLPNSEQLRRIQSRLAYAYYPEFVFGDDAKQAKKIYRQLSKIVHPDSNPDATNMANTVFEELSELWKEAETFIDGNLYAEEGFKAVTVNGKEFQQRMKPFRISDVANYYLAVDSNGIEYIFKQAFDSGDNDLLQHEAEALNHISEHATEETQRYYPKLFGTFVDDGKQVNIFTVNKDLGNVEKMLTLEEYAKYLGRDVPAKHIGWIWRKVVTGLAFAHRLGIINAAVNPATIWFNPAEHTLVLMDWTHASLNQQIVTSFSLDWQELYPPEVFNKEEPLPGLDFYMAAKAMLWAATNLPASMKSYFAHFETEYSLARPDKFDAVIDMFDNLIFERLGWKREFIPMEEVLVFEKL